MKRILTVTVAVVFFLVIGFLMVNLFSLIRAEEIVERQRVKVTRVIDGDTIEIEDGVRVRYLGIDTPEMAFYGKKSECFAYEATKRNKELVLGKEVELEKVVSDTDKYGRKLRFIFIEGKLLSEQMLREGLGREENLAPDDKYGAELGKAETEARENKRGLWGECE